MFDHWKDFFHPHEGNDHHPHAYRKLSAIALACVVGLVLVITAAQAGYIRSSDAFLSSVLPPVLVDLTNENRQDEGLGSLESNDTLAQAAQLKANHMAENGYFAHDSPSGVTPWEWFDQAGYTYETAGENLAIDFSDSDAVVEAWMDSRLHRENILEENFTEIGIATAKGQYQDRETVFVVQMFARPDDRELAERHGTADEERGELAQAENAEGTSASTDTTTTTRPTSTEDLVAQLQNEVNEVQQDVVQQESVEGTRQEVDSKNDSDPEASTSGEANKIAQNPEANSVTTNESRERDRQAATGSPATAASTSAETTQPQQTPTTTASGSPSFQAATSGTPTPVGQVQGLSGVSLFPASQASGFQHLISQPQKTYQLAFLAIAGLVLLALLISVLVEAKHHHWKLAGYSMTALVVLVGVFYLGSQLLFVEPTVAGIAYF
jgi:hypothetical protein